MVAILTEWASGTVESLKRQQQGVGRGLTPQQVMQDLRAANQRLIDQLADARDEIADLQRKLAVYEATAGRDELVTQTEAARRLHVHPGTVSRWVAAGHFQLYTAAGKKPLIYASSLHKPRRKARGRKAE